MPDQWRYMLLTLDQNRDAEQVQDAFNAAGADGWELVTRYNSPGAYNVFVFKRPRDWQPR